MAGSARRRFWTAVMWLALVVFLVAGGYLGVMLYSYWNDSRRYQEISETVFEPEPAGGLAGMSVDWDALRAINPEVVAWVYVPDTVVSYPVCYSGDNRKYLDMNFDGGQGVWTGSGTIFLDASNKPDFSDQSSVLYGHHMNDGSMFACLSDFADAGVFGAHRDVYVLTPERNFRFTPFSMIRTDGSDALVVANFPTVGDMAQYVKDKQDRSMVVPEGGFPSPADVSQMLVLSTCDYNEYDGRAVVFCSLAEAAIPAANASEVIGTAEAYAAG